MQGWEGRGRDGGEQVPLGAQTEHLEVHNKECEQDTVGKGGAWRLLAHSSYVLHQQSPAVVGSPGLAAGASSGLW